MRAEAYAYADGAGPMPEELYLLSYINRFGADAVYGRPLSAGELRRMTEAEDIVKAYHDRQRSSDWVRWAQEHPAENARLNRAMALWQGPALSLSKGVEDG